MKKVIILHGTGRSGTTVLNNLLVNHPELAWLSNYQLKSLNFPIVSILNRFVNYSVDLNDASRNKFLIHSCNEPYELWRKFYPSIDSIGDEPKSMLYQMNDYLNKICRYAGKEVFVTKITGQARAAILNHAFRNYHVVWIDRDPRAVLLSMMKQQWFFRSKNEMFKKMSITDKISFYAEKYRIFYESKFTISDHLRIDVRYEDLVEDPEKFMRDLVAKLELDFPKQFEKIIRNWQIHSVDLNNYKEQMSHNVWTMLNEVLRDDILKYESRIGHK